MRISHIQPTLALMAGMTLAIAACGPKAASTLDSSSARGDASDQELKKTTSEIVKRAQDNAFNLQIEQKYWDMPSYLGLHYTSQYYLFLRWTGREKQSALDVGRLRHEVLASQLPNGGWITVRDRLQHIGDINATVMNYAALKAMGEAVSSAPMVKARNWILKNGGLDGSSAFTQVFFSLFSQAKWTIVPETPLGLFNDQLIIYPGRVFAQWLTPNMFPIAYLRSVEAHRKVGATFDLSELLVNPAAKPTQFRARDAAPTEEIKTHLKRMLGQQQPHGSFGAYTLSTMLSIMALDDFKQYWPGEADFFDESISTRGMQFLDRMYVNNASHSYLGVVDDGHIWDTLLMADALLSSGVPPERLSSTAHYLASRQVPSGGLPFGDDFDHFPDTDDTALVLPTLVRFHDLNSHTVLGGKFIVEMQNSDGGLGAFAKNNYPSAFLELLVGKLKDSADLFDESAPDIIGHALEGIGRSFGPREKGHQFVKNALAYLTKSRDPELKAWSGRWGVNYLYGTAAVVAGLSAIGFDHDHEFIRDGLAFLASKQNPDGGFGEISTSDSDKRYAGIGPSTPSQTAWVLSALLTDRGHYLGAIERAVRYLNDEFQKYGKWQDYHAVGTGHPQIIYMEYPSYPYAFPLKALGQYLQDK